MRFHRQIAESPRALDSDPDAVECDRSCPVRLSRLNREWLSAVLLIGVATYLFGMADAEVTKNRPVRQSLSGHEMLVEQLLYAPDSPTLISGGWDKRVRFWNVEPGDPEWGQELGELSQGWPVFAVTATVDGKYLAVGGAGGFKIWTNDSQPGTWELTDEHDGGYFRCMAASPDDHTLAIGDCAGIIRLRDLRSHKDIFALSGFRDQFRVIAFSPSGSFLAASTFSGEFRIWDLRTSAQPRELAGAPDSVQSFVFGPDDRTLVVAQSGPRISALGVWDLPTCALRLRLSEKMAGTNMLAFSPDGRVVASADQDAIIRFWNPSTGDLEGTLHDGAGWVKTLAFSADGRQLAYASHDGKIQIRDLAARARQTMKRRST